MSKETQRSYMSLCQKRYVFLSENMSLCQKKHSVAICLSVKNKTCLYVKTITYPCILFFQKTKKYSRKYLQIQKKTIFLQDKTT